MLSMSEFLFLFSEKRKLIIPPHLGYGARGVENVIPREYTHPSLTSTCGFICVLLGTLEGQMYKHG